MREQIRSFFAPPKFPNNEDKTRVASLLNVMLWTLSALMLPLFVGSVIGGNIPAISLVIIALTFFALLSLHIPMRRGYVKLSSGLLVVCMSAGVTVFLVFIGTIRTPGAVYYVLASIIAGLLVSRRAALISAATNSLVVFGLLYAEISGLLPPPILSVSIAQGIAFAIGALVTVILLNLATRNIDDSLALARRELSERRRMEQVLRESEARNRTLLNAIPDMIFEFSRDGVFLNYLPAARMDPLVPPGTFLGKNVREVMPPAIADASLRAIAQTLSTGVGQSLEYQLSMPEGVKDYEARFTVSREEVVLTTVRDISERKRAEKQVRQLVTISRSISSLQNLENVFRSIYDQLGTALPVDTLMICLYNAETNQLTFPFVIDEGQRTEEAALPKRAGTFLDRAITKGEQILINRTLAEISRITGFFQGGGAGNIGTQRASASLMYVPITAPTGIIGAISAQSYTPNAFDQNSLEFLGGVAAQAAIAIENARLYESQQEELAERKRAQQELRKLSRAIEQSPVIVTITDAAGNLEYVNPAFTRATGYARDEVLGQNPRILKSGFTSTAEYAQMWQTITQGGEWRGEFQNRNKHGEVYWADAVISPIMDESGKITNFMAVEEDITARKRAEDALRESEDRYRRAIEAAGAVPYQLDHATDSYTFLGEGVLQLTGYSAKEMTHRLWDSLVQEAHLVGETSRYSFDESVRRSRAGEFAKWQCDYRIRTRDGGQRWITSAAIELLQSPGVSTGSIGILQDISERKQTEETLREQIRLGALRVEIGEALARGSQSRETLQACSNILAKQLDVALARFWTLEPAQAMLELQASAGLDTHLMGSPERVPLGKSKIGIIAQERTPYLTNTAQSDSQIGDPEWAQNEKPAAFAGYPLLAGEHVMGVMAIYSRRALSDSVMRELGFVADVIAQFLDRMRIEEMVFEEKERAQVTLHSIGDAVITTDANARVQYLNPVAEEITGWNLQEAAGQPLANIFQIIEEASRKPAANPVERCLREGKTVGLANHSILISRHGKEYSIDDSAAPIRNRRGEILGAVMVFHDISESRRLSIQMAHDAAHDSLTGLVNRREFEKRVEKYLISAKERGMQHILCYVDLDQFKIVNDTAGHMAGDELLKRVASLLAGLFRQRDTFARLGGDEFGLLLENCPLEKALAIANEITARVRDYLFIWEGRSFQIGASIGIVQITAESESATQLLSQADIACYTAKDLGRGRTYVYQSDDSETAQRHSDILQASRLRDAIVQDQFRLYCQPIKSLNGERSETSQYEVLLRMEDESRNLILPGAFIPSAERFGLMASMDRWVIRETFRAIAEHQIKETSIAINLSGNSLDDEALLGYVREQMGEFNIPSERICFEITETAAIHHLAQAQQFIRAFREQGGKIALDDFGSGLSSFRYLKTLPVDYLKIDGSFISDMVSSPSDHALVEAIHQLARTLRIETIAEHVENRKTLNRLRAIGVNFAQGYAIGHPVPLALAWEKGKHAGKK